MRLRDDRLAYRGPHTGVCEETTTPDKKKGWNNNFESTKSGDGLQFLLLGCMAKARAKGMIFQTPVSGLAF